MDLSYCNALKLPPDQFISSFQLCNTPILGDIQRLMMPDMRGGHSIQAELYKLNIYSGPGGHFKVHVDTPRSSGMFRSFVVCLLTQFSDGRLVTHHQGKEVRFGWSSSVEEPMQKVSWAAFLSDVEHKVLPVTDGHHLTLTYNLYCVDNLQDVRSSFTQMCVERWVQSPLEGLSISSASWMTRHATHGSTH